MKACATPGCERKCFAKGLCRACYTHARYWADPERARDIAKRSAQKHRDANLQRKREQRRVRFEANPSLREKKRACDRARRAAGLIRRTPEQMERQRLYNRARVDEKRAWEREHRREHPALYRLKKMFARTGLPVPAPDDLAVLLRDPCAYCNGSADTIDHIVPTSKGGTNEMGNLTAACRRCNAVKGQRSLLAFLVRRAHRRATPAKAAA